MGRRAAWLVGAAIVLSLAAAVARPYVPGLVGGPASYALVAGEAMEPALSDGDLAVFRASETYETGDVVAYQAGQDSSIASVVERGDGNYLLRPDAVDTGVLRVASNQVTGSLEAVLPRLGAALSWLRDPLNLLVVPAVAALTGAVLLLVGGLRPRLGGGRGAPGTVPRRWRRFVVPVRGPLDVGGAVVDVSSLAGLVVLARRLGRVVLEVDDAGARSWLVNGDDAVYRYRPAGREDVAGVVATSEARDPRTAPPRLAEADMLTAR